MNLPLLSAGILSLLAFFLHTFGGDYEIRIHQPDSADTNWLKKQETWTMARSCWHLYSVDLLFASLGIFIIYFTAFFENESQLILILSAYFLAYALAWLIGIAISKKFPKNYLKLGQWILLVTISGLLYYSV